MDAARKAALEAAGIRVDEALPRFMGREAMLEKYLKKFPGDGTCAALAGAVSAGDWDAARMAAHTLKSLCGTLGMNDMQALVVEQERLLKAGETAAAADLMPRVLALYEGLCAAIGA